MPIIKAVDANGRLVMHVVRAENVTNTLAELKKDHYQITVED